MVTLKNRPAEIHTTRIWTPTASYYISDGTAKRLAAELGKPRLPALPAAHTKIITAQALGLEPSSNIYQILGTTECAGRPCYKVLSSIHDGPIAVLKQKPSMIEDYENANIPNITASKRRNSRAIPLPIKRISYIDTETFVLLREEHFAIDASSTVYPAYTRFQPNASLNLDDFAPDRGMKLLEVQSVEEFSPAPKSRRAQVKEK